jgi:hypothetical protein
VPVYFTDSGSGQSQRSATTAPGFSLYFPFLSLRIETSAPIRKPLEATQTDFSERDSVAPIHSDGALWRIMGTAPQFGDSSLYIGATQHRSSLNNSAFQISRAPYDRDSEGTEGAAVG